MKKAVRLTPLGERMEMASTMPQAPRPKTAWRMAKCSGSSRRSRMAAAGLEVKLSRTPMAIRMPVAANRA